MVAAEATEKLGLHSLKHMQWFSQSAGAIVEDGFYESLDALVVEMRLSRLSVFQLAVLVQSVEV